jgi:protein involved in polysaccharide export with SLBB domain
MKRGFAVLAVAATALVLRAGPVWCQNEAAPAADVAQYVIAPGDVLDVQVYDDEPRSGQYRIDVNGNIFVPEVGEVHLAGYTLQEGQARLTEALKAILKRPVVAMRLNAASSTRHVNVVGAVNGRGAFELPVGATVMAAIAQAQGFSDVADPSQVLLVRVTGEVRELNLSGEDLTSAPDARVPVQNGDTISVPVSKARITVLGPLQQPGRFVIRTDAKPTVLDAISSMAKGPLPDTNLGVATVLRQGQELRSVDLRKLLVEADLSQNVELEPGDIVYVNEAEAIGVVGAVNNPLSFAPGPKTTVIDAISRAGGLTTAADLAHTTIRRGGETVPVDLSALWIEGDMDQDVTLEPGDVLVIPETANEVVVAGEVVKPGAYAIHPGARAATVISQAGGPTELGDPAAATIIRDDQSIAVDMDAALKTGEGGANITVRPGDVIYVPPRGHVYVMGAVNEPGPHAVHKSDTVMDALADAGGTSARANTKRMVLARRRDENGKPMVVKFDMAMAMARSGADKRFDVQPGDVIFVPDRGDKRTWSNARDAVWMLTGLSSVLLR